MANASAFELDALDTKIRELVDYARERDGEDRTLLFRNLVDLFLTGKAPHKQPTRSQLLDVVEALIPHVEPEARRTVADLVAQMSDPPLDLALRLAKDRPHLVGTLLKSTAFDEEDIIGLIARTGRDHHQAIASRNDLSANVWIALARAAPAAPPFDNQSTLALWSNKLGGFDHDAPSAKVTPIHTGDTDQSSVRSAPLPEAAHEPVTGQNQRTAASLRILRTDKDLIADRIEKGDEIMVRAAPEPDKKTHAEQTPTEPLKTTQQITADQKPDDQISDGQLSGNQTSDNQTYVDQAPVDHKTAEWGAPGTWSWRSDRDGFVTMVSLIGMRLFPPGKFDQETTILDMLGLNDKLGHPVSRAFQRRSAIHDAPLVLDAPGQENSGWMLEATPVFSANGGIFEGYDGTMKPVPPRLPSENEFTAPNIENQALFLDEVTPQQAATGANQNTLMDEKIDRTSTPPPAGPPSGRASNAPPPRTPQALIAETTANMVQDLLSGAFSKPENDISAPEKTKPLPDNLDSGVQATLEILQQTLEKLVSATQTSGNASLRLHAEIAVACVRTLADQLGKSNKP